MECIPYQITEADMRQCVAEWQALHPENSAFREDIGGDAPRCLFRSLLLISKTSMVRGV